MPSKGIQIYTFLSVPGSQVEYSVPGQNIARNEIDRWADDHLEVDKNKIKGTFNFTGRFSFRVTRDGNDITSQWCDINALTGNLEQSTMKAMRDQRSVIRDDIVVTYGFYDADQGQAGLPSTHQCWVTVTPNHSNWLEALAPPESDQSRRKFSSLVLPAAHDIGMNSMQNCDVIISHSGKPLMQILKMTNGTVATLGGKISDSVMAAMAPDIISSLSITQKDTLSDVLQIGARYFEFRPAHLHSILQGCPLPGRLYFQHGPITGMAYEEFLHGCVDFLTQHQQEIIVVQIRWDGVPNECAHPSNEELDEYLHSALAASNGSVECGSVDDMRNKTIEELRNERKRLILFQPTDSYSTYTDEANATLRADPLIQEFEKLGPQCQEGKAFTNIQCQATATNIRDVIISSVISANASNSCLLATKAICDAKTLPWIRHHALEKLTGEGMIVIMNDFFDGATADVAIGLSRQRLG